MCLRARRPAGPLWLAPGRPGRLTPRLSGRLTPGLSGWLGLRLSGWLGPGLLPGWLGLRLSGWLGPGLLPGLSRLAGRPGRGAKLLGRPVVLRIAAWRLMHVVHDSRLSRRSGIAASRS